MSEEEAVFVFAMTKYPEETEDVRDQKIGKATFLEFLEILVRVSVLRYEKFEANFLSQHVQLHTKIESTIQTIVDHQINFKKFQIGAPEPPPATPPSSANTHDSHRHHHHEGAQQQHVVSKKKAEPNYIIY
mmetsp:Transcript_26011/g.39823  ORF Transcript_26011/g.39823 Transcript_26011/m.39823 type:complete len:131 (-) Transcript_26011:8-400(-)